MFFVETLDDTMPVQIVYKEDESDSIEKQPIRVSIKDFSLLDAVSSNDLKRVTSVKLTTANKNAESPQGLTPLILATLSGNYEICKYLILNGVDINYQTQLNCTALSSFVFQLATSACSISVHQIRIILLLLRYGADASLPTITPASEILHNLGYEVDGLYLRKSIFTQVKKEFDLYA